MANFAIVILIFLIVTGITYIIIAWLARPHKTKLFFITIINHFKIQIMSVSINKNEFVNTHLALKDSVTGDPVTATFTDIVLTSSDEAIVTCNTDADNDGNVDVKGISVGEASVNVSATASYTNSNGDPVSESKTASVAVTVTQPTADGTELEVSFTPPA
jgi:hypothetical protein